MRFVIILFSILFAACSDQVHRVNRPKRIITLAPSVTEIIYYLNETSHLIAVSSYCDFPQEISHLPRVGGLYDASLETIVALKPDLVIGVSSQQSLANALNTFGVETMLLENSSLEEIDQSILKVAKRLSILESAENLIKKMHVEINAITKSEAKPRVLIVTSRLLNSRDIPNIYVAGNRTWYGDILKLYGAINAYDGNVAYTQISQEGLIAINPQIIIEMLPNSSNKDFSQQDLEKIWSTLPQIDAVRNNKIFLIKDDYAVRPGPRYPLLIQHLNSILK